MENCRDIPLFNWAVIFSIRCWFVIVKLKKKKKNQKLGIGGRIERLAAERMVGKVSKARKGGKQGGEMVREKGEHEREEREKKRRKRKKKKKKKKMEGMEDPEEAWWRDEERKREWPMIEGRRLEVEGSC